MIRVNAEAIKFFKSNTDTDPCMQIKLQDTGTTEDANRSLQFPNTLPGETKALTVTSDGVMGYDDLGESALTGTYEQETEGAVGIEAGSDTLSSTAQKIDGWLFRNLVDAPPAVTELFFAGNTTTSASVEWTKPTIYHLGLLDRTVPFITGLSVKVYKNDAAAADVTGGSGTVSVAAGSTDVAGSSTTFTSTAVAVGDSVTITSGNLTGTADASGTALTGTGTAFSTELAVNQNITIGGQTRRITAIASDTSATVALAFASDATGQTFVKSETRVVTAVGSDTSLTVDKAFAGAVSASTATFVSYSSTASETQDSLTTTVNHLPREDATTVVEAITLIMDGGSTGQSGTVSSKNNYDVASSSFSNTDLLKFEVYYTNHNDNLSNNVAYLADVEFKQPGAPGAPSGLAQSSQGATSMGISWTAPADNDVSEAGNQTTPAIEQYQLTHSSSSLASGVARYGGAQTHNEQTSQTGNTNTSATLSSLKPGQTYAVTVAAKNTINASYGATDSASLDTGLPSTPTLYSAMSSLSSRRSIDNYTANGRTLGAYSSISSSLLLKKSELADGGTLDYTAFSNLAVNESNANLESDRHQFEVDFDGSSDISGMSSFRPFDSTFAHAGAGNTTNGTNTSLVLSGQEDAYTGDSTGFWAVLDAQLKINTTSLAAREASYGITLRKLEDGTSLHAKTDTFYVDDLANDAAVTALTFVSFPADADASTISGVATRGNGFQVRFHADIQHLGRYFVRYNKFADLKLQNGSNTFHSTTLSTSSYTSFSYSDGTDANTAPLDSSKSVRFENLTLTYSDPGSGIHTRTSDTSTLVEVHVKPYNIQGQGAAYERNGIHESTNDLDSSEPKIYVDTVSSRYLSSNYDKASGSGVHYPARRRLTEGGETPTVSQASHQVSYDHTQNLATSSYTDELQFVNGRLRTKQDSNAYLNYGSLFLDHPTLTAMPDYSGISATGYRYATFLFDLSSGSASTISYIDVKLKSYTLGTQTDGVVSDFKLYAKLIDNDDYSPADDSSYSSIWLDGNAVLASAVTRSQTNYSDSSKEPLAVLQSTSTGNTNNTDTKRLVLVSGTSTVNLKVLVRIGLDMSQNHSIGHIELECAT